MIRRSKFTAKEVDAKPVMVFGPARIVILSGILKATDLQSDGSFECSIAMPESSDFARKYGLRTFALNDYFWSKLRQSPDGNEFHLHIRTQSNLEEFLRVGRHQG